ncbi:MAG: hypothetical protein WD823_11020 [Sulfuricaulis sp.]|uniref:hypothetical protein n=1 Tax=Sulfuricaulis sp. TaxID=2003553 RepID=UPI0034A469CD
MPEISIRLPPTWLKPDGTPVSCVEKIKVLNENFMDLRQAAADVLEDAILMGCSEPQIRAVLHELVDDLVSRYDEASSGIPD